MLLKPFNYAVLLYSTDLVAKHLRLVIMVSPNACAPERIRALDRQELVWML